MPALLSLALAVVALAVVVGAIVRLTKPDVPLVPNIPARWRPVLAVILGQALAAADVAIEGLPWAELAGRGALGSTLAMLGHQIVIEWLRRGRELFEAKVPAVLRPQMPAAASEASKPPPFPSGDGGGMAPPLLAWWPVAVAVGAVLGVVDACTPAQVQALTAGVRLVGVACAVVEDVADRPEVAYVCDAVDVAAPLVSLLPTTSASAPPVPSGAKAGPPSPVAKGEPTPRARVRVVVPRAEREAFERAHGVRR